VEWEPKHGSINTFVGQHPLRDRARKLDQGILVIRFEMPWNTFCLTCQAHIPKGVRFNAQKSKAGKYLSTTILSFKMKCHHCDGMMEIQTDPQNRDYACIAGIKRREMDWKAEEVDQIEKIMDADKLETIQSDPIRRLENRNEDEEFASDRYEHLDELHEISQINYKDDFANSQLLRASMREKKKQLTTLKLESKSLGLLEDTLLPKDESDKKKAKELKATRNIGVDKKVNPRLRIRSESIFKDSSAPKNVAEKAIAQGISPSVFKKNVHHNNHPAQIKREQNGIGMPKPLSVDLKKRRPTL